eukprot:UN09557
MDNIHVITPDNKIHTRLEAQTILWETCGWTTLAWFVNLPIIRIFSALGYDFGLNTDIFLPAERRIIE